MIDRDKTPMRYSCRLSYWSVHGLLEGYGYCDITARTFDDKTPYSDDLVAAVKAMRDAKPSTLPNHPEGWDTGGILIDYGVEEVYNVGVKTWTPIRILLPKKGKASIFD